MSIGSSLFPIGEAALSDTSTRFGGTVKPVRFKSSRRMTITSQLTKRCSDGYERAACGRQVSQAGTALLWRRDRRGGGGSWSRSLAVLLGIVVVAAHPPWPGGCRNSELLPRTALAAGSIDPGDSNGGYKISKRRT